MINSNNKVFFNFFGNGDSCNNELRGRKISEVHATQKAINAAREVLRILLSRTEPSSNMSYK